MNHRLSLLCRCLQVSCSGYHAWCARLPCRRATQDVLLGATIASVHHECRAAYGSRRLWRELQARGIRCGRHHMDRLRQKQGLMTHRRKRFLRARRSYNATPAAPRLLQWPFRAAAPGQVWVGDISQIATREGVLHLAVIQDVCTRLIVGWAMSHLQLGKLAEDALDMALLQYRPDAGLTLHHDQGSQYRSLHYRAKTAKAKIRLSMSRPGMPYDNAMIESFFANLKLEINDGRPFENREAARTAVFEYIEVFYNRTRLHSGLGYTTPLQAEQQYQRVRTVP